MYTEHFGLESPVVHDGIARDDRMFRAASQQAVMLEIGTALCRGDSVALIHGPAGVGKSTVAAAAFRESATQLALGCLPDAPQTAHELLEQLLLEFGYAPYKLSRTERLAQWRQHLAEMSATGTRIAILVEDADEWQPDVLGELEKLSSADVRGGSGANLLLTARQPVPGLGTLPALTALCQRCRCVVEVAPMPAAETADYIGFCIERAGGDPGALLEDGTAAAIHAAGGGIVRLVDSLLETCLARAAREGADRIGPALVARVVASLPAWSAPVPEPAPSMSPDIDPASAAGESQSVEPAPSAHRSSTSGPQAAAPATPRAAAADIPVLDDAVTLLESETVDTAPAVPAQEISIEVQLDDSSVDDLLLLDEAAAGTAESDTDGTTAPVADGGVPELVDAIETAGEDETDDGEQDSGPALSDEDRQQIEMLEAFANAEFLEQISESMAETIFGDSGADEIARSVQRESEDDEADSAAERDAAAS